MGTEQEITVQAAGLFDSGNNPYALPPGALLVANDVEITRDNVIQGRRGMARNTLLQFTRFEHFRGSVLGLDSIGTVYLSGWVGPLLTWDASTGSPLIPSISTERAGIGQSARSVFISSDEAVGRLDYDTNSAVAAGMPQGRSVQVAVGAAGSAVQGQTRVAYRVVFGRKDAYGRLIFGAPSGRVVFTNTNASTVTNDVTLNIALPVGTHGVTSTDFVQVYRTSGTVDIATTSDPGDECYLVAEVAIPATITISSLTRVGSTVTATTSAPHGITSNTRWYVTTGSADFPTGTKEITVTGASAFTYVESGAATTYAVASTAAPVSMVITDSQPDGTGGASLYTNPSQETILNQNARPPRCSDMTEFGGCLWFAAPAVMETAQLTLLGVPAAGIAITIGSVDYVAGATESSGTSLTSATFLRYTTGTPDENIRDTVASLCRVINWKQPTQVIASTDYTRASPGKFTLGHMHSFGSTTVTFVQPTLFATQGKTTASIGADLESFLHGLVYSKPGQPDHVSQALASAPITVGSAHESVKRIVPTRSALFIFKNDGVWKATGSDGNFSVTPLDPTTSILAPESAVALDNNVYLLTDQGFARVSESGVEIISRPIEQIVRDNFTSATIACASEGDHKYRAWCGTTCVVYDPWTKAWTTRSEPFLDSTVTAVINERTTGRLLVSGTSSVGARTGTYLENLTTLGDSLGETVTVSTADEATTQNSYNITHSAATLVVGDTVDFTTGQFEVIQATDSTHSIVLATTMPVAGTFPLYRCTGTRSVSWQIRPSRPGTLNEWQELVFQFLANVGLRASVNLATDFVSSGTTNIDLDLVQTRLTNGDGFNQIRVWPAREDSLSAVLVATLSWGSSLADIRLAGLTTRFVPSSWQVSR